MMDDNVDFIVLPSGDVKTIYSERIDLAQLGKLSIRRGSHVEPTADGQWTADLSPCGGPALGPFSGRSEAIAAEIAWLTEHWLNRAADAPEDSELCQPAGGQEQQDAHQSQLYHVRQIVWDTDDLDPSELDLPSEVLMRDDPQEFADLLSDYYGWCVSELDVVPIGNSISDEEFERWSQLPLVSRQSVAVVTQALALTALQTLRTNRR